MEPLDTDRVWAKRLEMKIVHACCDEEAWQEGAEQRAVKAQDGEKRSACLCCVSVTLHNISFVNHNLNTGVINDYTVEVCNMQKALYPICNCLF